jgi:hypothetical protein
MSGEHEQEQIIHAWTSRSFHQPAGWPWPEGRSTSPGVEWKCFRPARFAPFLRLLDADALHGPSSSERVWRSVAIPRRTRLFTVPGGMPWSSAT